MTIFGYRPRRLNELARAANVVLFCDDVLLYVDRSSPNNALVDSASIATAEAKGQGDTVAALITEHTANGNLVVAELSPSQMVEPLRVVVQPRQSPRRLCTNLELDAVGDGPRRPRNQRST
jgi:hypothetical protein